VNSGIYVIVNEINGKVYIGSTKDLKGRWAGHRASLRHDNHENSHLQHSWNKYGEGAFEFGILEYLDDLDELVKAEQFWMDIYREEGKELYNFGLVAAAPARGYRHTEEAKQKLREANLGKKLSKETRYKIGKAKMGNQYALGCKRSKETRQKISESLKGRKMPPKSKEAKLKWSRARMGHPVSLETCQRISDAKKGVKTGPMSEERKKKIGDANRGKVRTEEQRRAFGLSRMGENNPNFGKSRSKETRRKQSESMKAYWVRKRESDCGSN